jgi:hypothetical protein
MMDGWINVEGGQCPPIAWYLYHATRRGKRKGRAENRDEREKEKKHGEGEMEAKCSQWSCSSCRRRNYAQYLVKKDEMHPAAGLGNSAVRSKNLENHALDAFCTDVLLTTCTPRFIGLSSMGIFRPA